MVDDANDASQTTTAVKTTSGGIDAGDLAGVKTYLTDHTADLAGATEEFAALAVEYDALAKSVDYDYARLLAEHRDEVSRILEDAKKTWIEANPYYEQVEGVVAGTPSLAEYDIILDAGSSKEEDPESAVPFDLKLSDGRVLEQPGNLFNLTEGMLWGTRPDLAGQAESDLAIGARADVEAASRKPEILDAFLRKARAEHGRAGPQSVADDAEERRKTWVTKRLVQYGRARAQTLGWPDNYTFTKAMGERAVEELAASHGAPLSIVRPSIIESSYAHPFPGWIAGFKMAEPIIRACGRGTIPDFPGIPEGIIDIIPADFVVNAMLAAAARPPEPASPAYYHVSSGSRNPLQYKGLYENVKEYFERDPLPQQGRGAVKVPEWTFPGNLRVERLLRTAERAVDVADRVVTHLPKSKAMRDAVARVDRDKARVDFVKRYSDLYGMYTETEVVYTDERVMALWESLGAEDRERRR